MLTKLPSVRYIPGTPYVPPVPAVPHVPAHTVCGTPPRDSWTEYECSNVKRYLETNTGVQLPWGASIIRYGEDDGGLYVIYSVCRTVTKYGPPKPVVCTDYPEQPGVPGVPAVPAVPPRTEIINLYGWDSGANSETILEGPSRLWFEQPSVVGAVIGYTTDRAAVPAVGRYAHAFYFYQTPSGQPRFALREFDRVFFSENPYEAGDAFEIRLAGGRVEYLHNDELLRRSASALAGELSIGSTLYASGDEVPSGGGGAPEPDPEPEPDPDPEGYRFYAYNTSTGDVYYGDLLDGETEVVVDTPHAEMTAYMAGASSLFQCNLAGDPWTNGVVLSRRTSSTTRAITTMLHDGTQISGGGTAPTGNRAPLIAVSSLEQLYRLDHPTGSGPYSVRLVDPTAGTLLSDVFAAADVERLGATSLVGGFARTAKGQYIVLRPDGAGMRMAVASGSSVNVQSFGWVVSSVMQDRLNPDRIIGVFNGSLATAEVFEDGSTSAMDVIAPATQGQFNIGYGQQTEDGAMFIYNGAGADMVTRDGNTTAITVSLPGGWPSINPNYYAVCRIAPADVAPS